MSVSSRSTTSIMGPIVKPRKSPRVWLKQVLILRRTRRLRNSDPSPEMISKKLLIKSNLGIKAIKRPMTFLTI